MPRNGSPRALIVHAAAYAAVVAISAGVNFWLSPGNLWFLWLALGWGISIAAHALAFWLRTARRRERIFNDPKVRGFTVHLFAYGAVVILLFVVNLTATPNVWWFYWVALGWGLGVAFHAWCTFFRKAPPRAAAQRRPPAKKKAPARKRAKRG